MRTVRFKSYSQDRKRLHGILLIVGLALVFLSFVPMQWKAIEDSSVRVLSGLVVMAIGVALVGAATKPYLNNFAGDRSENRIEKLLEKLGDDFVLVRNWKPYADKGDIDLILFGSFGAVILESKFSSVPVECKEDKWFVVLERGYRKPIKSYSNQLKSQIELASKFIPAPVTGAVVFNRRANLNLNLTTVTVINQNQVLDWISRLGTGPHSAEALWETAKAAAEAADAKRAKPAKR